MPSLEASISYSTPKSYKITSLHSTLNLGKKLFFQRFCLLKILKNKFIKYFVLKKKSNYKSVNELSAEKKCRKKDESTKDQKYSTNVHFIRKKINQILHARRN